MFAIAYTHGQYVFIDGECCYFSELFEEATSIYERTCNLNNKVDMLKDSVQQFDPNQVCSRSITLTSKSAPSQLCPEVWHKCIVSVRRCPTVQVDRFRDDGKPSITLYTNPDYFVQLWIESLQKNVSESSKKHDGKKVRRMSRRYASLSLDPQRPSKRGGKKELGEVKNRSEKFADMARGQEFIPARPKEAPPKATPGDPRSSQAHNGHQSRQYRESATGAAPYQPPPPAPPAPAQQGMSAHREYQEMIYDSYTPDPHHSASQQLPPPNMVPSHSNSSQLSRASTASNSSPGMSRMGVPPPPPPPPPVDHFSQGLPPPPSPPGQHEMGIVPPPPDMSQSIDSIRPASPPPPMVTSQTVIPSVVPPPPPPPPPPGSQFPSQKQPPLSAGGHPSPFHPTASPMRQKD
ncbi:WASF2 [Bugula neritina]|uniref:WASF2 n=1 Tax=Bugula neritina TaxID=10212 RepID=A0A7J7KQI8_BUGNE|nr:WASF2 [Bugula neritina]